MENVNEIIKIALENTVLCRGTNGPNESYEYAEKMEKCIKSSIVKRLEQIGEDPEKLKHFINELKS